MSLGYDIAAALPGLRAQAESMMVAACEISHVIGETTDENGETVPLTEIVYSGKCRLRWPTATSAEVDAAGQIMTVQSPELFLPVGGSGAVTVGHLAVITANPFDEAAVGMRFRVRGLHVQTYSTARRLQVEVEL